MIYPMVAFPVTLSDPSPWFHGHGVIFKPIDALSLLCAQLTRDLVAIAKFLHMNWQRKVCGVFYAFICTLTLISCS